MGKKHHVKLNRRNFLDFMQSIIRNINPIFSFYPNCFGFLRLKMDNITYALFVACITICKILYTFF